MSGAVVIVKTVGDLSERPPEHADTHPAFPLDVREYATIEEAAKFHPSGRIMTHAEYFGFKTAMNLTQGQIKKAEPVPDPKVLLEMNSPRRAWWRFW